MSKTPELSASFFEAFGEQPEAIAFAPGRVNLIGEHTDYNEGFVLPMAIEFGVYAAGRLTSSGRVRAYSANFPGEATNFTVGLEPQDTGWNHFLRAIVAELLVSGIRPTGLDLFFLGDVPDGAGLSSSAAFSVAAAMLVAELVGKPWPDNIALARLCQAAEHRTGVMCGLLDQMASATCRADSAMLLDCRDLSYSMIPLDRAKLTLIVGDTQVKRELADGRYNQRRLECEAAATALGAQSLRDVSLEMLDAARDTIADELWRRARHVVTENERVHRFAAALAAGDYESIGAIANVGHASLRDDFEVSCPELDAMAESFCRSGANGARMVGAGFGGATIALVDPDAAADVLADAQSLYEEATGRPGAFYLVTPGDGARVTRQSIRPPSPQ